MTSETSKNENSLEIVIDENLNLNKNLLGGEVGVSIWKVRTHKGGRGLILAIFVRTYYVDDP